jgi:adenine-specific DNA-methyltransferase
MAKTRATKKIAPTKVESIRHKDKRANIPTEELRDFVAEDEHAPKTMLYPRDPSLDPQLVWKGKGCRSWPLESPDVWRILGAAVAARGAL